MSNNCKIQLKGHLGKELKLIKPENGKKFLVLSVATTDSYKGKSRQWQQSEPLWHEVIIFKPNAIKLGKELKKGNRVEIEGTLSHKQIKTSEGHMAMQASIMGSIIVQAPLHDKNESKE